MAICPSCSNNNKNLTCSENMQNFPYRQVCTGYEYEGEVIQLPATTTSKKQRGLWVDPFAKDPTKNFRWAKFPEY